MLRVAGGVGQLSCWPWSWDRGRSPGWRRRFREPIKSDSPELCRLHQGKQATPTMGGLFIVAGLGGSLLLAGDLTNRYLLLALGVTGGLTLLGAIDDLVKLRSERRGLSARSKLAGQTGWWPPRPPSTCIATMPALPDGLVLPPPLQRAAAWSLGSRFVPLAMVVIVGSSNAVNLTDGLDGLAGGCLVFAAAAMTPGGLCGRTRPMGRLPQRSAYRRLRRNGRARGRA